MANLERIPLQDGFKTTLRSSWDGLSGTISVNTTPDFTFPIGVTTCVVINPTKSNVQVASISAYDANAKTLTVDTATLETGAGIAGATNTHSVNSEVIISDNYSFWNDIRTAINSKIDADDGLGVIYADETERDAAITSPSNGMQVYVTSLGLFTDYIGGAWTQRATGSTPNASETVAGKVELATQVEFDAGTDIGGTGASLSVLPSQVQGIKPGSDIGIPGEIRLWTTSTAPSTWLLADGTAISRTTYADLFAVISTAYGAGDGSTTFNLPDLRGRVPVGVNGVTFGSIGATGGSETHILTVNEMPAHRHGIAANVGGSTDVSYISTDNSFSGSRGPGYSQTGTEATGDGGWIESIGGGAAHNNIQPYLALNYIIKT